MVIPLEITSKVTQNFSLLYMVKVLTIDLYRVKGSLGSHKCNAQVFTLDFVSTNLSADSILLDLAAVVLQ